MNIRNVDLNLLKALNVLLEENNVSKAARKLSLTQPTVSAMLSRLRDLFQDPLFIRAQHGMIPTPKAEALKPMVERFLADAHAIVTPKEFDPAESDITFKISVNDYMQAVLIVPLITRLQKLAPNIKIGITNQEINDLEGALARGEIDMAITIPIIVQENLHQQHLYRDEFAAVVRPDHPILTEEMSLENFLKYQHTLVAPQRVSFTGPTDLALKKMGKKRQVTLSVPNFLILNEILRDNDYIAVVPQKLFEIQMKGLKEIPIPLSVRGFDVVSAWHIKTHYEPSHIWIREQIKDIAKEIMQNKG